MRELYSENVQELILTFVIGWFVMFFFYIMFCVVDIFTQHSPAKVTPDIISKYENSTDDISKFIVDSKYECAQSINSHSHSRAFTWNIFTHINRVVNETPKIRFCIKDG